MKRKFLLPLSAIVVALFIAATQLIGSDAGARSVSTADLISIEQPQDSGRWKASDLTVEYSYSKDRGQIDLSGNVQFSYSLVMGYALLQDFRLGAVFLDQNGRVLQEIGLATNRGPLDPIPFHRGINVPSNAAFIGFTYQGTAIEAGGDDGSGLTNFWYNPYN